MPREHKTYISDIIACIDKIERYIGFSKFDEFVQNDFQQDAVVRNLEIIGEVLNE